MASHDAAKQIFLLPNGTFIVELLIFIVVLGIMARYVLPPAQRAMRERREMVAQQLADSENARNQLVAAEKAYQDALHDARIEASKIREDARVEAQRTVDELRGQAQAEAARIVARGEAQLAGQRETILRELRGEIGTLAVELSSKIVEQPLAQEPGVTSTVDAFVAGLVADDHARRGADA